MDTFGLDGKFESISQRVVSTYRRMLTDFCPILPDGLTAEQQDAAIASQRDLHAFFGELYHVMYKTPDLFGLPVTEDVFLINEHSNEGPNKTDVKRILDRPRKMVDEGMEFLRDLAIRGRLEGDTLVIQSDDPVLAYLKKKPGKSWVKGLAAAGLELLDTAGAFLLSSERFPRMISALQALAHASTRCEKEELGRVFFARCDFQALKQNFSIDPLDLYRTFRPEDYAWAAEQHAFFTGRGYQPQVFITRMFGWEIKYQGKRSIKGSPLFQIDYDERLLHQMRVQIKCAAAFRVAPLVEKHSQALQDDFMRRVNSCHNCSWCDTRPHLGPTEITYKGEQRKICWYVNSDLDQIGPNTSDLVREYADLHEELEA